MSKPAHQHFKTRGIEVLGGITLAAGGEGGQFGTFDYELPADRQEAQHVTNLNSRSNPIRFQCSSITDLHIYTKEAVYAYS